MSDASQKHTDEQRGLADARASLHRFAPLPPELPPLAEISPAPFKSPVDDWEGWLERRKQIDQMETDAFNLKYGYTQ